MNKKIVSFILVLTMMLSSIPVFATPIDWSKITAETTPKELETYIDSTTHEERIAEMLRNDTYDINGKDIFSITDVWSITEQSLGNNYIAKDGSKLTLLCDVDKMIVIKWNFPERSKVYVAPDGYDASYAKEEMENLPAGTTFTFTRDAAYSSNLYDIAIVFDVPDKKYDDIYYTDVLFYNEGEDYHSRNEYYDYAMEKYKKIKSAPAALKNAEEAYSHRYGEINYWAGNGDYVDSADQNVWTTSKSQTIDNGKEMKEYEAYNINGNNYFKLRDICWNLTYAGYFVDVTWDGANNAINLVTGQKYTEVGGENMVNDGKNCEAIPCNSKILLNGKEIKLTAYTINGNNYFKLRDLCRVLNVFIKWDAKVGCIVIDPSSSYVEN